MSTIDPIIPGQPGGIGDGGPIVIVPGPIIPPSADASVALAILKKVLKDEAFDYGLAKVSLHYAHPGLTGAFEISAARQSAIAWDAASGGLIANTSTITFTSVPVVTATHVGLWSNDETVFIAGQALDLAKTITGGTARFLAGDLKFSVSNRFSTYLANKLLDYMLKQTAFTTAPVFGAIHTGTLDESGGGEVTGGTYIRQELEIASWADTGTSSLGDTLYTLLYNAAETWNDVPNGVTGRIGLWDAETDGNFLMWGPDITLPSTDVTSAADAISATITQTP